MLTYSFTNRSGESLYEYLYKCIKEDIISGILKPHEKLPSKRAFALNHGISVITVESTYGQLMAEGYIYSKPKSGFYVSEVDSQINLKSSESDLVYLSEKENQMNIINLVSNHTATGNFPFSVWAKIMRQMLTNQDDNLLKSPPTGGVYELRLAICRHLLDFRGISCTPEQIIIGAGTEYLYNLIVQLLDRNKIYGLENPSSKKIRSIYQALGVKVTPLEMDKEGIKLTPDNMTIPDIVQISPSHHFPTGIVTSVSRRYGLLQWVNESSDRYIIEDDYDSEFRLQGKPIPSLFSMDETDKVIYFNTFTKSLASTIRISYMVLPKPLLEIFNQKLGFYSCTVSNFEQYTLAQFINEKYFEKHINRMRNHYRMIRDHLIECIKNSSIGIKATIREENAGLHFLLELDTTVDDTTLQKLAFEKGIKISFLSDYYSLAYVNVKKSYEHTAIINYYGFGEEDIPKIAEGLENAWKSI